MVSSKFTQQKAQALVLSSVVAAVEISPQGQS